MHILIIDDDVDIRETLALLLESQGHQVEEAGDGLEALARLREGSVPDLTLLDLMMPRLDGEGLIEAMSSDARLASVPVCIISGHRSACDRAEQLGAVGCLVKPFELDQLSAVIRRVTVRRSTLSDRPS